MTRPKGMPKTRGRQKGSANKLTAGIKPMILGALSAKGGQRYFEKQADRNPAAFMAGRQADREFRPQTGSPPAAPVSFRHRGFPRSGQRSTFRSWYSPPLTREPGHKSAGRRAVAAVASRSRRHRG